MFSRHVETSFAIQLSPREGPESEFSIGRYGPEFVAMANLFSVGAMVAGSNKRPLTIEIRQEQPIRIARYAISARLTWKELIDKIWSGMCGREYRSVLDKALDAVGITGGHGFFQAKQWLRGNTDFVAGITGGGLSVIALAKSTGARLPVDPLGVAMLARPEAHLQLTKFSAPLRCGAIELVQIDGPTGEMALCLTTDDAAFFDIGEIEVQSFE